MDNLAKRLKELRKKSGITQAKFAEAIGIQRGSVANYEVGKSKPSHENLKKIANIFNVSMQYLVNGEDSAVPKLSNFISMLGNDIAIEPRIYNIEKNLIPIHISFDTTNMYAIKVTTNEMHPTIKIGDTLWCRYDKEKLFKEDSIVHYEYKGKSGIRRVKIDEVSESIVLVPDNLENNSVLVIIKENRDKVEVSEVVGYSRIF